MRVGQYELLLVGEDSAVFEETWIGDRCYFHATPDRYYHVKINVYRDPVTKLFPCEFLRFGLYIDGNDVQYWKRLDLSDPKLLPADPTLPVASHFYGFKKHSEEIRAFKIAVPSTSNNYFDGLNNEIGTIKVVIFEARITQGVYNNRGGIHEIPHHHSVSEGKKFWQQASVATTGGKAVDSKKEQFLPLARWENVSTVPLDTIVAHYHSPNTITILQQIASSEGGLDSIAAKTTFANMMAASSSSKKRSSEEVIDLISDDEGETPSNKESRQSTEEEPNTTTATETSQGDPEGNDDIEPEVSIVEREVAVPLLDLSEDQPVLSSVILKK